MARPLALALAPAALLVVSCGAFTSGVDVTRTASGTVPGAAGARPLPGGVLHGLGLTLGASVVDQSGISRSDLHAARLVGLKLAVTQGASLEAWLDAVSVYIEAPDLPRMLLAKASAIRALPAPARELQLEPSGADLRPYLLAPSSAVTVEASGTQPPVDTTLLATVTIRVSVALPGF